VKNLKENGHLEIRVQIGGCIKIDLREICCKCMDWTHLASDSVQWRALVSTAINLKTVYVWGIGEFLNQLRDYQLLKAGPSKGKRREGKGRTAGRIRERRILSRRRRDRRMKKDEVGREGKKNDKEV
jgi:hypothetical protein